MASSAHTLEEDSYRQCSLSVMDTIADPNIVFDQDGVCNYYHEYKAAEAEHVLTGAEGLAKLEATFGRIRQDNGRAKYDCILGLSGGVDSTYLCLLAKRYNLNPLIVHCDNGWNSELAQHNIEQTVKRLGYDLYTHLINWEEFRELQLSYLKASVVDIEVLTDHAFMAALYAQARKWKIRHVLMGINIVTEQVLPNHWIYAKSDLVNIKAIQAEFGTRDFRDLKTYPTQDLRTRLVVERLLRKESHTPLNYVDYVYSDVKKVISDELGWRDYGGKHYESVWTRFYQGYILPTKFGIDKRKAHYSNLIYSGQITKAEAERRLGEPGYSAELLQDDKEFVIKKLGLTESAFEEIMRYPRREHTHYPHAVGFWEEYRMLRPLKPAWRRLKKMRGTA